MKNTDATGKKRTSVTLTKAYRDGIDHLVEEGIYLDNGVVIRDALRALFRSYGMPPFCDSALGPE